MLNNKPVEVVVEEAVVEEIATITPTVPEDSIDIIGSVISNSARQNVYITGEWSSSGPWTTYNHSWSNANSIIQGFNMFMGDGFPDGTSNNMYVNDGASNAMTRVREYTHGQRLGNFSKDYYYYDNASSYYGGVSWRCIPVRNTTDADITRTLYAYLSESNGNYGGSSIAVYTPNSNKYSETTGGTWSTPWTGGSNGYEITRSGNITVPANTTVLVFINSTHTYASTYRFKDTNMLYQLDDFFDGDLLCDLRMLETVATARLKGSVSQTTAIPHELYTVCAALQGDR
jgi:hypothetical protein